MIVAAALLTGTSVLFGSLAARSVAEGDQVVLSQPNDERRWRARLTRLGVSRFARRLPHRLLLERVAMLGGQYSLESVLGLKLLLGVGVMTLLAVTGIVVPAFLLAAPLGAFAAFALPDFVLARKVKRRKSHLADQVPDLADLLLVMTEAGVSPPIAFRRAAEALPQPLGDDLNEVIRRLDLGMPWRTAMTDVADRLDVQPLRRLARALTRSQRLGTSLGSVLRTMAKDLRGERRTEAELMSRQAPVKMLFPLVFLILPAFLLLTVGPVVLSTIRSLQ